MAIDNTLQHAESIKLYADLQLNNTVVSEWSFEEQIPGGCTAIAGCTGDKPNAPNSFKRITNSQPLFGAGDEVVLDGFVSRQSIGKPFTNNSASLSFSRFSVINTRTSDEYSLRNWEDVKFTMMAGGVINGAELEHDQYDPWHKGIIRAFSVNPESIDLSLSNDDNVLDTLFPTETYADGTAKPYIFGKSLGQTPHRISSGVFQFHNGQVDTQAPLRYTPKYWYQGAANANWQLAEAPTPPATPVVTYGSSQFSWVNEDDQNVNAILSADLNCSVSVADSDIKLESLGDSRFSISYEENESEKFKSSDFDWQISDSKNAQNAKDPNVSVEVDGDIDIVEVGGRWFKIAASGTGQVSIKTKRKIKRAKLIIRAVRTPNQSVSNFNVTAESIEPAFTIYNNPNVSSTDVFNHRMTLEDINTDEISFDYTANTDVLLCAVWFEEIELYDNRIVDLSVTYSDLVESQNFFYKPESSSSSIFAVHNAPTSSGTILPNEEFYELGGKFTQFSVKVEIGHSSGVFDFSDLEYDTNQDNVTYGVFVSSDKTIIMSPRAVNTVSSIRLASMSNEYDSVLRFRARVVPRNTGTDNVNQQTLVIGDNIFQQTATEVQVYPEWNDFEVKIPQVFNFNNGGPWFVPDSSNYIVIRNTRTESIEYQIEFEFLYADLVIGSVTTESGVTGIPIVSNPLPTPPIQDIFVKNINTDVETNLKVFRVDSIYNYPELPPFDFCMYDSSGYLRCPPEYEQIIGDFIGTTNPITNIEALRDISHLSLARDIIDSTETGFSISLVCDEQRSMKDWMSLLTTSKDYYFNEDLVDGLVSVTRRFNFPDYPSDFHIRRDQIDDDSVNRSGSELRETRYTVSYQQNLSQPEKTKHVKSDIKPFRGQDVRTIDTCLTNKSDAESIASRIDRDSAKNGIYSCSIHQIGLGLKVGQTGIIDHPDIPKRRPCELREVSEDSETRETTIKFKVFQRD